GVRFIIIPNAWMQIEKYLRSFSDIIGSEGSSVHLLRGVLPSDELKYLLKKCDYLFSTSLHISCFALSVGTPVTVFPYVGKFSGILEDFGIADSQIEID